MAVAAATIVLTGCVASGGGEPDVPTDPGRPVAMMFSIMPGNYVSRTDMPFSDVCKRFGVWAWKTDADDNESYVMCHDDGTPYEVAYGADGWYYDLVTTDADPYTQYIKYWDLTSTQYDFVAFAPYRIPDEDGGDSMVPRVTFDPVTHSISIPEATANVPPRLAPEWFLGHTRRVGGPAAVYDYDMYESITTPLNPTAKAMTATVPMKFHYTAPIIDIRAYNRDGVDVSALTFSLTLVDADGNPAYIPTKGSITKEVTSTDVTVTPSSDPADRSSELYVAPTSRVITIKGLDAAGTDRETLSTLVWRLMELPKDDLSGLQMHVEITTADGRDLEGFFPLSGAWDATKNYVYYIIISGGEEIIEFDVDVAMFPWQPGNDIDLDEDFTNW